MEPLLTAASTLLALLVSALAWAAKIMWSKEYKEAKQQVIEAKEAEISILTTQIQFLEQRTPQSVLQHHDLIKQELEKIIESLKARNQSLTKEIDEKQSQLDVLQLPRNSETEDPTTAPGFEEIDEREQALSRLEEMQRQLIDRLAVLEHAQGAFELFIQNWKMFDLDGLRNITKTAASKDESGTASAHDPEALERIFKSIDKSSLEALSRLTGQPPADPPLVALPPSGHEEPGSEAVPPLSADSARPTTENVDTDSDSTELLSDDELAALLHGDTDTPSDVPLVGTEEFEPSYKIPFGSFYNLEYCDDQSIQALLREVSSESLAIALIPASNPLRETFYRNMTKRAADMLREDIETARNAGPTRLSQIDDAMQKILAVGTKLRDSTPVSFSSCRYNNPLSLT